MRQIGQTISDDSPERVAVLYLKIDSVKVLTKSKKCGIRYEYQRPVALFGFPSDRTERIPKAFLRSGEVWRFGRGRGGNPAKPQKG
jgi:hypothetical protein